MLTHPFNQHLNIYWTPALEVQRRTRQQPHPWLRVMETDRGRAERPASPKLYRRHCQTHNHTRRRDWNPRRRNDRSLKCRWETALSRGQSLVLFPPALLRPLEVTTTDTLSLHPALDALWAPTHAGILSPKRPPPAPPTGGRVPPMPLPYSGSTHGLASQPPSQPLSLQTTPHTLVVSWHEHPLPSLGRHMRLLRFWVSLPWVISGQPRPEQHSLNRGQQAPSSGFPHEQKAEGRKPTDGRGSRLPLSRGMLSLDLDLSHGHHPVCPGSPECLFWGFVLLSRCARA